MKHSSNFVEDYANYRPSYPRELLNKRIRCIDPRS